MHIISLLLLKYFSLLDLIIMYLDESKNVCKITTVKLHQYMIVHYPLFVRVTWAASFMHIIEERLKAFSTWMVFGTKEQPSTQARSNNSDPESQVTENEGCHLSPKGSHVPKKR